MTPYEAVREEFEFPFELYPFQIAEMNELAVENHAGFYWEPGTGKTAGSTHWMLYQMMATGVDHWLVVVPPIILPQWVRWLRSIRSKRDGQPLTVTPYVGSPKQRKELSLSAQFTVTSYGLFKNDLERLMQAYEHSVVGLACDEAHAVKNIKSQTYKAVRDFSANRSLTLLTGTPLTKPLDGYAYIKFMAPSVYRNYRHFEMLHVKGTDDYGEPTEYDNLDLLAENMKIRTSRVLRREVNKELPPVTYNVINYNLDPAHFKLYKRIAEEKLVEFDDGREIDAISTQALYSALQQVILNWGEFEGDDTKEPAALELIEEVFDEIGPTAKLAVVAHFIRSNRYLLSKLQKYQAVAVYGETSASGKQKAIERFITDPACRCILLQPTSAGTGVDGLQSVCSDMLILEAPTIAPPFYQVVARIDRDGQQSPVNCRVAVANQTVQVRMFKNLLNNDATVNAVQGGYKDLREAIYGY